MTVALSAQKETEGQGKVKTALFLSVVIPAYNEADNISRTVLELKKNMEACEDIKEYEILIIDDHSSDETFFRIQSLTAQDSRIQGIRLSRRSGSHTALRAGIARSKGDATLCIAADGQDDPQVLGKMAAKIKSGNDIIWALRSKREEPFLEKMVVSIAYRLITLLINTNTSSANLLYADFFMFSKKFARAITECPERNTSLFGLMIWLGFKQDVVFYERRKRISGRSKWSLRSKFRLLADWIIAFSGIPLKLISLMGLLTASLGFFYAFFLVFYRLFGYARPGWASIVILVLVLGGVQMLMLGMIGEYLWRNLDETRMRPLYLIESATDSNLENLN